MLILLLLFSWKRLISHQHQEYSHRQWNQLILRQCLKRMIGLIKATWVYPSLFYQIYPMLLKKASTTNCRCFLIRFFLKYQCRFRKGFSAQRCLIKLLEQWKKSTGQGLVFGALLTDLPNRFNCLSHELLVAKLSVYRIEDFAVTFISNYLINRNQRTKIGNNYSS